MKRLNSKFEAVLANYAVVLIDTEKFFKLVIIV